MESSRYAQLFLTESREHLSAINLALLDLERAAEGGTDPVALGNQQRPAISTLFRAVHSVKGMSATMGYAGVASLAHELEAVLDRLRQGAMAVSRPLMDALFQGADGLESSIEQAVAGLEPDPRIKQLSEQLHQLVAQHPPANGRAGAPGPTKRAAKHRAKSAATSTAAGSGAAAAAGRRSRAKAGGATPTRAAGRAYYVRVQFIPDAPLRGVRAAMAIQRARSLGQVTAIAPSEQSFGNEDFGATLRCMVRTTAPMAELQRVVESVGDVVQVEVSTRRAPSSLRPAQPQEPPTVAVQNLPAQPDRPPRTSSSSALASRRPTPRRRTVTVPIENQGGGNRPSDTLRPARHVRIELGRLDSLMNLIGELVIARGRLVQLTGTHEDSALAETVGHVTRLIGDLHDEILTCRMVPVWQVFDRFPRLVRDAAQSLGKEVAFEVDGKEIELDRSMLDEIGDPIVHLLRNAVDHGIESPAERVAAGKPREGRLSLSAARDRSAVLIRVTDDGRGIDRAKVLARAIDTGLVDAATTSLTDEEVIRLIARPGFTTADQVTDLSGRGVGIDAVQARVRALGGAVEIRSTPGQGTTVTARLPLTLAIMRALLARIGGETYAFPMGQVDETVAADGAAFAAVRGQPVLLLRGNALPFHRLRELVAFPEDRPAGRQSDPEQHIVVVESGGNRAAIAVDELTGQQDIVVKQFDGVRGGAALFSGATILGDGAPALIVDVSSLF